MKALILSGGKGTRLRPLTHTGAKQLVPIANKPIIFYVIENIVRAGIKDLGIIISPDTGEEVKKVVGDGRRWGVQIKYIVQEKPQGLAHAVKVARDFLQDDDFLMYLGDNLLGDDIKKFKKEFTEQKPDALILLKEVSNPESFGVAEVDDKGKVKRLEEKPKKPKSNLALVGVYIFSSRIHQIIDKLRPSLRGELEITDAIQQLIEQGRSVISHTIDGWWLDTGKKDDLLSANTVVLDELLERDVEVGEVSDDSIVDGRVVLAKGVSVQNSEIRGPVIVGENTVIENSFIGPFTSIGDNCEVRNANLEHSVVLKECQIQDVRDMRDSLLGRRSIVKKTNRKPQKSLRLMVGDDSKVEV